MKTAQFDYELPTGLIAQVPVEPRDSSRLMVVDRQTGTFSHRYFRDLPEYVKTEDCLVVNDTRVLPARLEGTKEKTGGQAEVLLLAEVGANRWESLVRPAARLKPGTTVIFGQGELTGLIEERLPDGRAIVSFQTKDDFHKVLRRLGKMPLPPYIKQTLKEPDRYQTVYAREERSAAAPTAGLHFTPELLKKVAEQGARIAYITLDVGLDTFRPIKEEEVEQHRIHSESFRISDEAARSINQTIDRDGRIISVGTTSARVLETAVSRSSTGKKSGSRRSHISQEEGRTELFIYPGYQFKIIDCLITNFHLPRSTLLALVSAFGGTELIRKAYQEAIDRHYRFFSFGDAMLII